MSDAKAPTQVLGAADTYETGDAVYVKVDIPGMSKSDVNVSVTDGNLHVMGNRVKEASLKDAHFFHSERQFGKFSRYFIHAFSLPCFPLADFFLVLSSWGLAFFNLTAQPLQASRGSRSHQNLRDLRSRRAHHHHPQGRPLRLRRRLGPVGRGGHGRRRGGQWRPELRLRCRSYQRVPQALHRQGKS